MNKNNITSLIVIDLIVMLFAVGLIVFRYNSLVHVPNELVLAQNSSGLSKIPIPSDSNLPEVKQRSQEIVNPKPTKEFADNQQKRNIRFTYRTSKAKNVEIIGDFNDWIPQEMTLGDNFTWSVNLQIAPGEYAYNYIVDSKPIRDPNNRNTFNAGRGFPNSLLKVKPK